MMSLHCLNCANGIWCNANSLGLRLVISLVEQLDGTIELDQSAGTAFTIVVKEKV
jgi:two-component sensor histidine kinase